VSGALTMIDACFSKWIGFLEMVERPEHFPTVSESFQIALTD
jgi:hypothetical protein